MQQVEIRIKGTLDQDWKDWFDGLAISNATPGETVLTGLVVDHAALYGVISRLRDLGLKLTWLSIEEAEEEARESGNRVI